MKKGKAREFKNPSQSLFVGREKELDILKEELTAAEPKTVGISGVGGIGKSSLAIMFSELNRSSFPAGVFSLHASQFEGIDKTAGRDIRLSQEPLLIVIDDLDARPQERIGSELNALRHKYRSARIIGTSRTTLPTDSIDLQMRIEGLSEAEFRELLEKRLAYSGTAQFSHELYNVLAGHPLGTTLVAELLERGEVTRRELLERLQSEVTWPGVVDNKGVRLPDKSPEHRKIIEDVVSVSDQFLQKLHDQPDLLYKLTSRGFEELVAELLGRLDYEITLTSASKDGGKDIYAAKKDHLGTFLYIVECKRYAPDHPVGVGLVRQLHGVVQAEQATAGILATTSFFTKGAEKFQSTIPFQMSLKDYLGVQRWLEAVIGKKEQSNYAGTERKIARGGLPR